MVIYCGWDEEAFVHGDDWLRHREKATEVFVKPRIRWSCKIVQKP